MGYKWMCMLCKSVSTDQHLSDGVWVEEPKAPRHWGLQAKVDAQARHARAEAEEAQSRANAEALAALATPPPDPAPVVVEQPAPPPAIPLDAGKTETYRHCLHMALGILSDAKAHAQTDDERGLLRELNNLITMSKLLSDNTNYHE